MGASDRKLVNAHIEQLLTAAAADKVPEDLIGRLLVQSAIGIWRRTRTVEDIASELEFIAENLNPDLEYPFMRP